MINYNKLYEDTIKTVSMYMEYNEIYNIVCNWNYNNKVEEIIKQYIESLPNSKHTDKILETINYFYGDSDTISVKEVRSRKEMLNRFLYKLFLIIYRELKETT